ncbi:MAG: cell division protein ZapA [Bacteroidetes bacterium]|nr:cell division protein ZapA [Bacteroidota bacterium]MBU1719564.1 cell division protein ZapA [Bacteroidota bacterium]
MGEITITVTICDRPYRLKIDPSEEERVRRATRQINEKIHQMSGMYAYKDNQDLLAMVVLQAASRVLELENETVAGGSGIQEMLLNLDKVVTDYLGTK